MNEYARDGFNRKVGGGERAMLMIPFNVIMVARIRGHVDAEKLSEALNRLRRRHALLSVRVVSDENDEAWFVTDGVPEFNVEVVPRQDDNQWIKRAEAEFEVSFSIERGPLSRFILVQSPEVSELIICSHHAVCDGISLTYLIRDILQLLENPDDKMEILPDPPVIDNTTVPSPLSPRPIQRKIINLMNRRWEKKNIRFDHKAIEGLHSVFWEQNEGKRVLTWMLTEDMTRTVVERSRKEKVTVNTALWAAFLAAQREVQSPLKSYHQRSGMAVSTRDKLLLPVGESFGFYASSLTVQLNYDPEKDFWQNAAIIHGRIIAELEKTQLFRMLIADLLSPSLIDSLYFSKYRLIKSRVSNLLLKMMNFNKVAYGYSITNVGRANIPSVYGALQLDSIYGPAVYSDVNEKFVGVITLRDRISFMMTYNENNIGSDTARHIRDASLSHLSQAIGIG